LRKAIDAFQASTRLDPRYALAWAGLADAYSLAVPFSGFKPEEYRESARAAAARAVGLDSTQAEVHTALGFIAMFDDHHMAEAERRFSRALELNPSYAPAHLFRAWSFLFTDRRAQAFVELEHARELDPLSLIINTRIGTFLHYVGQDREAIAAFHQALDLDSTFAHARAGLALSYAMTGRFQEALAMRPNIEPMLGNQEAGEWGVVLALAGRPAEARRALAELEGYRKTRYVSADALAAIHAALGETDAAFAELDRAAAEHAFSLIIERVEPMFKPLHADPRWARFVARLNRPAAQ
jgi:tetratricopeptide (TPR) repeat protein